MILSGDQIRDRRIISVSCPSTIKQSKALTSRNQGTNMIMNAIGLVLPGMPYPVLGESVFVTDDVLIAKPAGFTIVPLAEPIG